MRLLSSVYHDIQLTIVLEPDLPIISQLGDPLLKFICLLDFLQHCQHLSLHILYHLQFLSYLILFILFPQLLFLKFHLRPSSFGGILH